MCKVDVYGTTADDASFHEHWYRRDDDPETRGHAELILLFDPSVTCSKCRLNYKKNINKKWLECNICDQRFHEIFLTCKNQSIKNEPSDLLSLAFNNHQY